VAGRSAPCASTSPGPCSAWSAARAWDGASQSGPARRPDRRRPSYVQDRRPACRAQGGDRLGASTRPSEPMPKPRDRPQLRPTTRWGLLLLAGAGAIVAAWLVLAVAPWPSPASGVSRPAANSNPLQTDRAPPRTPEPRNVATAAKAPVDPLDDPSSATSAHAGIAGELNLVGVRCHIPRGLPLDPPVGNIRAGIQGDQYSNAMQAPTEKYAIEVFFRIQIPAATRCGPASATSCRGRPSAGVRSFNARFLSLTSGRSSCPCHATMAGPPTGSMSSPACRRCAPRPRATACLRACSSEHGTATAYEPPQAPAIGH
jgi:hypothetical protein